MPTLSFNDAVRRLAQYRPFNEGSRSLEEVLGDLAVAAAAFADGSFLSLADCQKAFADLWGLDVEIEELRKVRTSLVDLGLAVEEGGGFTITPVVMEQLQERAKQT